MTLGKIWEILENCNLNLEDYLNIFTIFKKIEVGVQPNTTLTNKYKWPLSLFLIVDCNNKSCLLAQAFIQDETEESYLWLLKCLKHTNIEPKTIITDSETAMIGALQEELPNTFHVICIYHLSQNLSKQLKSILGKDYIKFLNDFYTACNSISEDIFEYQWKRLQAKYLQAENYLTNTLYIRQKYPGHIVIFTSDMQSTQRIFNGQIHYSQPHIVATVFSEVSKDLNQWLSPALY
ncbi:hypothetical protein RirG_104790 [Rhizophagus irregularis DAOM 197198w]|uniref:MULE transposase domain-containing protein n=2 Tax=Rhizophagus irregularis TaxID=588596 RepID=A0A015JG35_RHIIW|nr:hypothetical protein RirG_104790 [Rhizophagus irregularis DAOM 197198w]